MKAGKRPTLFLASRSARRKEILRKLKIPFRVIRSSYHERMFAGLSPRELTIRHATGKVRKAVAPKRARWILGADTVVAYQKHILGKPKTKKQAIQMLAMLSGRAHFVYTGLAVWDRTTGKIRTAFAKTKVTFKCLDREAIRQYLEAVDPFDKAGGYAIQEGPKIVAGVDGSYTNVMGLPVELLKKMLRAMA